jgi:hypothetical protein
MTTFLNTKPINMNHTVKFLAPTINAQAKSNNQGDSSSSPQLCPRKTLSFHPKTVTPQIETINILHVEDLLKFRVFKDWRIKVMGN